MTTMPARKPIAAKLACVPGQTPSPARLPINAMWPVPAIPRPVCAAIPMPPMARLAMTATLARKPIAAKLACVPGQTPSRVPLPINATWRAPAIPRPVCAAIPRRPMAPRAATAMPVRKPIAAKLACAPGQTPSRVPLLINVTLPGRAIRQRACAAIPMRPMAPRAATAMPVRKPIAAKLACAPGQTPSRVPRPTNATLRAPAIRQPVCAATRTRLTARLAATTTLARKWIAAKPAHASGQTRSCAQPWIPVMLRAPATRQPVCAATRTRLTARLAATTTLARKWIAAKPAHASGQTPSRAQPWIPATSRAPAIQQPACATIRRLPTAPRATTPIPAP